MDKLIIQLLKFITKIIGVSIFSEAILIILSLIISVLLGLLLYYILYKILKNKGDKNIFFKALLKKSNFKKLSIIISAFIFRYLLILENFYDEFKILNNIIEVIILVLTSTILRKIISSFKVHYSIKKGNSQGIAINSLFELTNIFISTITLLLSISILFEINVGTILGTLGALMAVITLIFKDLILGFVAGIQVYYNKTVKLGDWVQLPNYNADGVILEIGLVNTKVQNWDKTITAIPTYVLISTGVKNWDNISKLNVRRIKRSILVDVNSITFFSEKDYKVISQKYKILKDKDFNSLTNITMFRLYALDYLEKHKDISNDMTLLVRQLQPNQYGVPLEIYCFTNVSEWGPYEYIQAEIIEYLIAIAKEFNLQIFQSIKSTKDF